MQKLKVKNESLPARCEICHQTDRFDPLANYCSRCSSVPQTRQAMPTKLAAKAATLNNVEVGIAIGMTLGALSGMFVGWALSSELALIVMLAIGYAGMCLGGIHGVIVGAIMGRSAVGTDGADGALAPGVIAGAVGNIGNRRGLKKFDGLLDGAFAGASVVLPFLILIAIAKWDLTFLLSSWKTIAVWLGLTMLNGAPIGFVSRNRSDRRSNPPYMNPAE